MIDPALHTGGVGRCIYEWFWIGRSIKTCFLKRLSTQKPAMPDTMNADLQMAVSDPYGADSAASVCGCAFSTSSGGFTLRKRAYNERS